jgi:hypothetical protein
MDGLMSIAAPFSAKIEKLLLVYEHLAAVDHDGKQHGVTVH